MSGHGPHVTFQLDSRWGFSLRQLTMDLDPFVIEDEPEPQDYDKAKLAAALGVDEPKWPDPEDEREPLMSALGRVAKAELAEADG